MRAHPLEEQKVRYNQRLKCLLMWRDQPCQRACAENTRSGYNKEPQDENDGARCSMWFSFISSELFLAWPALCDVCRRDEEQEVFNNTMLATLCVCTYACMSVYLYICGYGCISIHVYVYMCVYGVSVHVWVCVYTYMCLYIYEYIFTHMYIHMSIYLCILMHMYLCISVCFYTYVYSCTFVYMCVCVLAIKSLGNGTGESWVQDSSIIIVWPWGNFLASFSFNHLIFK